VCGTGKLIGTVQAHAFEPITELERQAIMDNVNSQVAARPGNVNK
jgi:hypothetical protein